MESETEDASGNITAAVARIVAEAQVYKDMDDDDNTHHRSIKAARSTSSSKSNQRQRKVKVKKSTARTSLTSSKSLTSTTSIDSTTTTTDLQSSIPRKPSREIVNGTNIKEQRAAPVPTVTEILVNKNEGSVSTGKAIAILPPPANTIKQTASMMDLILYLNKVQSYFNQLGYRRQGEPDIRVNTHMSMKYLMETAKSLIKAGQSIKCLHALVMAIHFTNVTSAVERFPINFKSEYNGKEYKHVVLGIYLYGRFGALGISRDIRLQDKAPTFLKLSDLVKDYIRCYSESGHTVLEIKIGGVVTHNPHSQEPIQWRLSVINLKKIIPSTDLDAAVENSSKQLRQQMGYVCLRQSQVHAAKLARSRPVADTNTGKAKAGSSSTKSKVEKQEPATPTKSVRTTKSAPAPKVTTRSKKTKSVRNETDSSQSTVSQKKQVTNDVVKVTKPPKRTTTKVSNRQSPV